MEPSDSRRCLDRNAPSTARLSALDRPGFKAGGTATLPPDPPQHVACLCFIKGSSHSGVGTNACTHLAAGRQVGADCPGSRLGGGIVGQERGLEGVPPPITLQAPPALAHGRCPAADPEPAPPAPLQWPEGLRVSPTPRPRQKQLQRGRARPTHKYQTFLRVPGCRDLEPRQGHAAEGARLGGNRAGPFYPLAPSQRLFQAPPTQSRGTEDQGSAELLPMSPPHSSASHAAALLACLEDAAASSPECGRDFLCASPSWLGSGQAARDRPTVVQGTASPRDAWQRVASTRLPEPGLCRGAVGFRGQVHGDACTNGPRRSRQGPGRAPRKRHLP